RDRQPVDDGHVVSSNKRDRARRRPRASMFTAPSSPDTSCRVPERTSGGGVRENTSTLISAHHTGSF
ncbi:MAG: hypothetical protein M3083_24730, partial [Actinomycetota bacterium]|nr:hypothetical protein [Actinomycetota bacterium]